MNALQSRQVTKFFRLEKQIARSLPLAGNGRLLFISNGRRIGKLSGKQPPTGTVEQVELECISCRKLLPG